MIDNHHIIEVKNLLKLKDKFIPFKESYLASIYKIKIYFLYKGRNAWYGTWIKRYNMGNSFFLNKFDAEWEAEEQRKQGNVFYIEEIPALLFNFSKNYLMLISEINTDKPLSNFNYKELEKFLQGNNKKRIYGKDMKEFFTNNIFWKYKPNFHNSLSIEYHEKIKKNQIELLDNKFKLYKSYKSYYSEFLEWEDKTEEYNYKQSSFYINKIFNIFNQD